MKKVVSFSGGRTSAYLCYLLKTLYPEDELDFIFMDTGAEHEDTYRFIREVNENFKLNLTCLVVKVDDRKNKGVSYEVIGVDQIGPNYEGWKRMLPKYGHPYVGGAFCTDRMKTTPFKKYCDNTYGKNGYETWMGIRYDEPKRLLGNNLYLKLAKVFPKERMTELFLSMINEDVIEGVDEDTEKLLLKRKDKLDSSHHKFLAEISEFEKEDILSFWKEYPFDLTIPEHLGNCVFCIKKSEIKLATACRDEPEEMTKFINVLNAYDCKEDKVMYRYNRTLSQIDHIFSNEEYETLKSRMRGGKMEETNSCSESCEVFNLD